jgi:hypothetical protein
MRCPDSILLFSCLLGFLAACDGGDSSAPTSPPIALRSIGGGLVPLDQFGIGVQGPGVHGCRAAGYHEFDFWAGTWDVWAGQSFSGTNIVQPEVDGCVLVENWTGGGGGQGKSLNSYDAATGTWHQMWVSDNGCPFSVILMEGGLADGRMLLQGRREQPLGFQVGPPCGPPPPVIVTAHTDRTRWTAISGGRVLQQASASNNDAPLSPFPDPETLQGLVYLPVSAVTPIPVPPQPPSFCPFRPNARQFDFLLGTWRVHRGKGEGAPGTATVARTMGQCLIEERMEGPGGYKSIAFSTFDVFTQQWIRTWADNAGQRLFMTGGLVDGHMVFRGPAQGESGVMVRVTWEPAAPGHVDQRWSVSRDGGATWSDEKEVHFDSHSP